jgi:hypothetical protein
MHLASVLKYWTAHTQALCAQQIVRKLGTGCAKTFTLYVVLLVFRVVGKRELELVECRAKRGHGPECPWRVGPADADTPTTGYVGYHRLVDGSDRMGRETYILVTANY